MHYGILGPLAKRMHRQISSLIAHPASAIEVERAERMFYLQYLRERMTVFDVGANIGELTIMFARFADEGQVHAFEASGAAFEHLTQICRATGRSNIVLNQAAVMDHEGVASLYVYDAEHSSWNSLARRPLENYGITLTAIATEEVKAITIDTYCEKMGVKTIDLLKVDVEGAEYQVLLGARRMLEAKSVRCIVFEFGQTTFDMGNDPNDIQTYLEQLGYAVRNIIKSDPVFPGRTSVKTASFSVHAAMPR